MEQKFYKCEICGQMIEKVKETAVPVMCCGKPMTELVPGTTDASLEKHVPVYKVENNVVKVNIGSVDHPMIEEHYIEWISLQTEQGTQRKLLTPNSNPYVEFTINKNDKVVCVLAYCNLHGLWKA